MATSFAAFWQVLCESASRSSGRRCRLSALVYPGAALSKICATSVRYPCAVVSVVGRQLRNALSELGGAMKVLRGVPVHMISEGAPLQLGLVVCSGIMSLSDSYSSCRGPESQLRCRRGARRRASAGVSALSIFFVGWPAEQKCCILSSQGLHTSLLESLHMDSDPQFGPKWSELPCGKSYASAAH